ncbi:ferredoxin [Actinomadura sp. LOL_016]|uniref:ferredoxin n=1 Tax=unclassified Actinomadura TaxID=2626254 RepID=UPI003A80030D
MRVAVDASRCQGHTLCALAAPDVFLLDDEDGHSSVTDPQVPSDQEEAVLMAARTCPEQAIEVSGK